MFKSQIYIYPTDTVWGIGCDIYSEIGFREIAKIKKTTFDKPLSILFTEVEQILEIFILPKNITKEWLKYFFEQESTLGLPLHWSKIQFPDWTIPNTSYISIRCLSSEPLKKIYKDLNHPFFTTSLNLQGQSPITTTNEAISFSKIHAPNAILVRGDDKDMSGSSSSIIFIKELNGKIDYEIKREGEKIQELKNHLKLLSH
jgi:L-threonylcarbamoyladenylate synthase